jgi:hypothetical protein
MDTVTSVKEFFADIYIPLDCECLVAQYSAATTQVSLTEVYHVRPDGPLQMTRVGDWCPSGALTWTALSFYQRRHFHGITLKGAKMTNVS